MKKVVSIIFTVFIMLILLLNIFSFFDKSFLGYRIYNVKTGSMEPALHVYDTIIVKEEKKYDVGDIIAYKDDDSYVSHRIISKSKNEVITKGDANNIEDEPVSSNQIVGKVVFKIGFLRFILYLLQKPIFLVLVFTIGIIVLIISSAKDDKNRKE